MHRNTIVRSAVARVSLFMPHTIIRERGEREKKTCRARSDSDHHPGQQQQQQQPQQNYGLFFCFVLYPLILLAYKLLIFF